MLNTKINKKIIAVLGPAGTFSDNASTMFLRNQKEDYEKVFFPTIDDTFNSILDKSSCCIVPIENTLDGYVQRTLDLLFEMNIRIIDEIKVPVKFSLIANANSISEIDELYVQFKAHGQFRKFINSLNNPKIITTESNMESYYKVQDGSINSAAIIPSHIYEQSTQSLKIKDVTDSSDNYTRFIIIDKNVNKEPCLKADKKLRLPLYVIPCENKPGTLHEILGIFLNHNINLISILSRPTKERMGTYNFFIEIEGNYAELTNIYDMISELKEKHKIKTLGIYSV